MPIQVPEQPHKKVKVDLAKVVVQTVVMPCNTVSEAVPSEPGHTTLVEPDMQVSDEPICGPQERALRRAYAKDCGNEDEGEKETYEGVQGGEEEEDWCEREGPENVRRQQCDNEEGPEYELSAHKKTGVYVFPPTADEVQAALESLDSILRPKQKKGPGYVDLNLDLLT
jgi:hypothetical protein